MPNVLIVDGDNLLTIGFYGVKNAFYKGKHFGAIYHFVNTLRRLFEAHSLNKIVVFWDGENGSHSRKKVYDLYKENRRERIRTEEEQTSYSYQRTRVKQYLEELYVRQGEYEFCESDDCIAYYVQNSPDEDKIIYSSDGDLTQLVSDKVRLFNPSHQKIYKTNDTFLFQNEEVLIENVKTIKIICGDKSDNISGIKNLGIKKFVTFFPEVKTKILTVDDVIQIGNELFKKDKHNNAVKNLLTGLTKYGVYGDEFFQINKKIVSLEEPFLTDYAKESIIQLINEELDQEGRSYKNTIKMMIEDGIFQLLPKNDDAWTQFLNPFLRLIRKEKNKKIIKLKNYEQ